MKEGNYSYIIASREKAICDQLYKMMPVANHTELQNLLFVDLRVDEQELKKITLENLKMLAEGYPSRNVKKLYNLMRRMLK